jgi:zinc protease
LGERPFLVYAAVQSDKTTESVVEILKEIRSLGSDLPITEDEYLKVQKNKILELPGRWETMGAVEDSIAELVRFGLSDEYFAKYPQSVKSQQLEDLRAAARDMLKPDNMIWVVVGDVERISGGLRELGLGDVEIIELK